MIGDIPNARGFAGLNNRRFNTGSTTGLPTVSDPDQAYADITRGEYMDYIRNFGGFEDDLIAQSQTDTSLVDQAREDVASASALTRGISQRNMSRYGGQLTPAQQQQMEQRLAQSNTLGGIQSVNDARIAQREANTGLLADLINIGQDVNTTSQSQLGQSAANASARNRAYRDARAASRAQTYSTLGSLGAAAIFAIPGI
tara:strand:+ start:8358 stop:8957 length:600 start_codon:yes stop_codon:yes gene_type:complete